ncbi:hypothetical protein PsYK624_054900 [Phanerochaete sordida]|uniref:Uncharacterized protein n=1 Tax=Phanerochaete sordida TaxID=48140 RepID=A0A9P3G7R4_9APHY|nr:hypothetical protein PsYK624_054900 [Phanerochaete sordida]
MDPAAATPALPAPAPYVAPFLIGTVVSAIFFGVLSLQAFVFVQAQGPGLAPGRARPRVVVVLIWLLNALNLFSAAWSSYLFMVTYFGNLERLFTAAIPWSVVSIIVSGALSNCLVQSWFAWSVWTHYGRHPAVGALLAGGILLTLSFILALASKAATLREFSALHAVDRVLGGAKWLLYTGSALDFVLNLGLSVGMALCLARTRRSPLYRWDYLVTAPVVYMSHAGLFCLAEAFLVIVVRVLRPDDFIYFGVFIPYSTMYATALVGFLNSGALADAAAPAKPYALRAMPGRAHVLSGFVDAEAEAESDARATPEPLAVRVETVVEKEKRMTGLL